MGYDDDYYDMAADEYAQEAYEDELIENAIREQSEDAVRWYLGTYGDSVTARVQAAIGQAEGLIGAGFPSPALVAATTALELMIRFLIIRPLVQGAFLSDEWAALLTERVATGRTVEDRKLLPQVARAWHLDLESLQLPDGRPTWTTIASTLWPLRDRVVHRGDVAIDADATAAIAAAHQLLDEMVTPLAVRLRLSWPGTAWHDVDVQAGNSRLVMTYTPLDAFADIGGTRARTRRA